MISSFNFEVVWKKLEYIPFDYLQFYSPNVHSKLNPFKSIGNFPNPSFDQKKKKIEQNNT